ncbi:MAG: peptide chain release factor 1 [Anaerolineae bacterium]
MIDKLAVMKRRYDDIERQLQDPETASDQDAVRALAQERAEIEPLVSTYEHLLSVENELEQAEVLLRDEHDPELLEMAKEEAERLGKEREATQHELQVMLLPPDPLDQKDVIVEIRAGTGGDEAGLFAAELARMYMRYAEERRWATEVVSENETGVGGYKELAFTIRGRGAYSRLKYERGVHRVQRVPKTESSGRIHTSTATVAILPDTDEVQLELNPNDIEMEVYRSSGAGGQHMQKNSTAVRLIHRPTGMVVTCQSERSQVQNRVRAMSVLRARLFANEQEKRDSAFDAERKSQVGSAERSDKIRTYNFPQNRITDHRLGMTSHRIVEVMDGSLDEFIEALATREQEERLKELVAGPTHAR